jgi:formylglycine-generating enzyme required for sulfatase activity
MHEKQTETEDHVRLNPVMGIRPGVYLTVLYSIILLAAVFFILVFPGLKNPGAVLSVKTEPDGAAIRVDGVYMGTSRDKIFVPKGKHTLQAVLPGFESESLACEIPGRVLGSFFFPLRYPVDFTLAANDTAAVFAEAAADYAAWSFGGEPTAAWQVPPSLSEGAYRIGPEDIPEAAELLTAASRFTVTRAALRDLVRAKMLLDSGGLSPSPAGIACSVSDILLFLSENPGSAQWLSGLLPPESAAAVKASGWYKNETIYPAQFRADTGSPAVRRLELAGLSFIGVPSGNLIYGGMEKLESFNPNHAEAVKSFMISERPVPRPLFETFLNENPSWRDEGDGLFPEEIQRGSAVTGVSWFAAEAFCKWLSNNLPRSMPNMEIRLPYENEWEYAVRSGAVNMENNGWEWCSDPFAPLVFIKTSQKAAQAVGSFERTLRGRQPPSPDTRASLPPDLSSPFVTFRPVIAEKGGGN